VAAESAVDIPASSIVPEIEVDEVEVMLVDDVVDGVIVEL